MSAEVSKAPLHTQFAVAVRADKSQRRVADGREDETVGKVACGHGHRSDRAEGRRCAVQHVQGRL